MIKPDTQREREEHEEMFSIRLPYHAPCKLRNWDTDQFMKEEKTALAINKMKRGQLLLQKMGRMLRNLSKPLELSQCLVRLKKGENYQIVAPDIPYYACESKVRPVYLSGWVTEREIVRTQEFSHGSSVVGSVDGTPRIRNTFRFVGCERNKSGEPLNYGEHFYLQIVDDSKDPLYVRCENSITQIGFHPNLSLSKYTDIYCRFKILHFNPALRFEQEGCPIRANDRVVIQNVSSGKNLAVENSMINTFFGNEYEISCHTFKDSHKMETVKNLWMVVGKDLSNINTVLRAAKGEEVADEDPTIGSHKS